MPIQSIHEKLVRVLLELAAILVCPAITIAAEPSKPNILVILTGGQGHGDLGRFGAEDFFNPSDRSARRAGHGVHELLCPDCLWTVAFCPVDWAISCMEYWMVNDCK